MNNRGEAPMGMIISVFVIIIVGLVLIGAIADQQGISTTKSSIINESLDISAARSSTNSLEMNTSVSFNVTNLNPDDDWKQTSCEIGGVTVLNQSFILLVDGTDYEFSGRVGNITFLNTHSVNGTGNDTLISYTHCRDGYNTDSGARSIANLWTLFAAFALLAAVFLGIKSFLDNR